jgi:hypothetical protein
MSCLCFLNTLKVSLIIKRKWLHGHFFELVHLRVNIDVPKVLEDYRMIKMVLRTNSKTAEVSYHLYLYIYMYKNIFIYHPSMTLQPFVGPWPVSQFRNHFKQTVGLLGWVTSTSQGRYLNTGQNKHKIKLHMHPCLRVGFESTIPTFERAKTVHTLHRAATMIGIQIYIK